MWNYLKIKEHEIVCMKKNDNLKIDNKKYIKKIVVDNK
jgi:hypothetical protein